MTSGILRTALGVPDGGKNDTAKLVASITSLRQAQEAVMALIQGVSSKPPKVQQKLSPILSRYVYPLQETTNSVDDLLTRVAMETRAFCDLVADHTSSINTSLPDILWKALLQEFIDDSLNQAHQVESACQNAGSQLVTYRDRVNSTAAQLNTLGEQLAQEDQQLNQKAAATEQKLHDMADDHNPFDWIANGFKVLFGNLEEELKQDEEQVKYAQAEIEINKGTISVLNQMVTDMGDIASVASALETSWRNLGDSIGGLSQDISMLSQEMSSPGVNAQDLKSQLKDDLEYVNSDWQSVLQIVKSVTG